MFPRIPPGNVTKFAGDKTLKLIAPGKLTFDERSVVHRVDTLYDADTHRDPGVKVCAALDHAPCIFIGKLLESSVVSLRM